MISDTFQYLYKLIIVAQERHPEFGMFLLVGLLNTFIGYSIFALLTLLDVRASIALFSTYIFGVIFNYFTTGKLVFNSLNNHAFLRFIVSYVAIYFINLGIITQLMQNGISQLLSQAIVTPFMALLSFLIFKIFVFRDQ